MKKLLLFTLLICSFFSHAQNYQCLQAGVKHYFINGNGYLRGIRIDSVRTYADSTVYFPFRSPRGSYDLSGHIPLALNPAQGSWLGKKVLQLNDGTFIFDNYWNDSVVIKTQANPGDNWVFYSDSSSLYYKATLVSIDTMTVLSLLDSVKTIMVNAYNSSGHVSSDPLDSFNIILGKNSGFVQVFDIYTFPYHKPDSVYRLGLDFFLDRSTLDSGNVLYYPGPAISPNKKISLFNIIDFKNPSEHVLYNWNIGDVFQHITDSFYSLYPNNGLNYLLDTVINKVISGSTTNYTLSGLRYYIPGSTPPTLTHYTKVLTASNSSFPVIDSGDVPEMSLNGYYIFYFPNDTTHCTLSPKYQKTLINYHPFLGYIIEKETFKMGIGQTQYYFFDGNPQYVSINLAYTNINNIPCGPFYSLSKSIHYSAISKQLEILPNPATNLLTVKTTNTQPYSITLQNVLGKTVQTVYSTKQEQTINVSNVPAGVYNISVTDENGNRYNEKVEIVH